VRKLKDHVEQVEMIALSYTRQVQVKTGTLADIFYVEINLNNIAN
jgi:hypothetical protein